MFRNALSLSRYIVTKCVRDNYPVTNLQLQGILYCIQESFLCRNTFAFLDDFVAWSSGPTIPVVFDYFSSFGADPIMVPFEEDWSGVSEDTLDIVDFFIEEKRALTPWELVRETQSIGGAWRQVVETCGMEKAVIPLRLIRDGVLYSELE